MKYFQPESEKHFETATQTEQPSCHAAPTPFQKRHHVPFEVLFYAGRPTLNPIQLAVRSADLMLTTSAWTSGPVHECVDGRVMRLVIQTSLLKSLAFRLEFLHLTGRECLFVSFIEEGQENSGGRRLAIDLLLAEAGRFGIARRLLNSVH